MKVSDADRAAVAAFHKASFDLLMALPKADVNGAHKLLVQAFASHRHKAIEMAAKVADQAANEAEPFTKGIGTAALIEREIMRGAQTIATDIRALAREGSDGGLWRTRRLGRMSPDQ